MAVAVGMVVVSAIAWRRRAIPAAPWLAALCLAVAVWALADGLGAAAVSLGAKTTLSKVECLAALAVGPCWLLMTRAFTRRPPLPRWCVVVVWAVPVAFVPIIVANWHGLVWSSVSVVHTPAGFEGLYSYGPGAWAEIAYAYVLGAIGIVWLVQASRGAPRAYRTQAFVLAALATLPLVTNAIDQAGLSPFRQDIDLAPLAFGAGVVFLGWMLLRGGFLELVPLARDALLRTLPDGVLVVDQSDCVIEANRAAVKLLGVPRGRLLGRLETALAAWPPLVEACRRPMPVFCEIHLGDPDGDTPGSGAHPAVGDGREGPKGRRSRSAADRRLEVRVTALQDGADDARGRLVTLHDISERVRLNDQVRDLHLGNLRALSSALNAKDYYTFGHAGRVAAYVMLLGRELGWSDGRLATVQDVAYLHDIGKIGVSDRVLRKAGPLNAEEWELMRQHPTISAEIVAPLFESELIDGVRQHHERFGGGGYPDGLAGSQISDLARALCVADSYDAMSYERPYRGALSYAECCAELRRCSGSQFDPVMATAFLRALARLEERRRKAVALAVEATRLVDPAEHSVLRTRADEARPSYGAMTTNLRSFRRSYPSVRFLTTFAMVDHECVTVLDTSDDDDLSHCGDPWLPCDQLAAALEGRDLAANALNADQYGVWISGFAPIRAADGTIVGALSVDLPAVESPGLQQLHTDLSRTLASMLQATTRRGSRVELEAISDGLTGLYNHRYLHERLDEELARLRERDGELSLLHIDVDHFKSLNDARGHKAGDEALRRVARILEQCSRRVDLAARYGGDEFVLALVESGEAGAREVAERICRSVADTVDGERRAVTVSIGIANFPRDARTKDELLDKADWAMNAAKRAGRDRVMAFSDDLAREPASEAL